jgi:signal transduction histidine kinase
VSASELDHYKARCEALERDLRELSVAISHDLRAPVRALDGFSRALADEPAGDPSERARHLQLIRESAQRLGQQVDALVGLCRLSLVELREQPVDLTALAGSVAADLRAAQPDRPVVVQISEGLATCGDPVLLRILLESLMSNAWKFTGAEREAFIRVGQRQEEGRPAFFVADSGVGFALGASSRLFHPFARLHPPSLYPGLGVGLARARRVVQRHGGRIWPESSPGAGATFLFTLGG